MPVDLTKTFSWSSADADGLEMLADLQCNILKGHGRRATRHLFLQFVDKEQAASFLRKIEPMVTSSLEQLRQNQRRKLAGISGGPVLCVYLAAKGYEFLGRSGKMPQVADGGAFAQGMKARAGALADNPDHLEERYRKDFHAKLLIAGDPDDDSTWTSETVDKLETVILNMMQGAATVVASEAGRAIFNTHGDGLEHFGYVDGRSQPLLLVEDVEAEKAMSGIDKWDPAFPLSQVLVADPGGAGSNSFGSFFVFRKLEQNVKGFNETEEDLGDTLGLGELAGAMLVGRFEDGTPVELSDHDGLNAPIPNNFNYHQDKDGSRCPFHAHIRKTNPRGESAVLFGIPEAEERAHIMARRGIPFGRRDRIVDPSDLPSGGVGLLFMAHQGNIQNQFEFTQATWANNPGFLQPGTGKDPIIGQPLPPSSLSHFTKWNDPAAPRKQADFGGFVTHKGGEYFFAPAKSMLRSV